MTRIRLSNSPSRNHLPDICRTPQTLAEIMRHIADCRPPLLNKGKSLVSPSSPVSLHTRFLQKISNAKI